MFYIFKIRFPPEFNLLSAQPNLSRPSNFYISIFQYNLYLSFIFHILVNFMFYIFKIRVQPSQRQTKSLSTFKLRTPLLHTSITAKPHRICHAFKSKSNSNTNTKINSNTNTNWNAEWNTNTSTTVKRQNNMIMFNPSNNYWHDFSWNMKHPGWKSRLNNERFPPSDAFPNISVGIHFIFCDTIYCEDRQYWNKR